MRSFNEWNITRLVEMEWSAVILSYLFVLAWIFHFRARTWSENVKNLTAKFSLPVTARWCSFLEAKCAGKISISYKQFWESLEYLFQHFHISHSSFHNFNFGQGKKIAKSSFPKRRKIKLENICSHGYGLILFSVIFLIGASACLELNKPEEAFRWCVEGLAVSFCHKLEYAKQQSWLKYLELRLIAHTPNRSYSGSWKHIFLLQKMSTRKSLSSFNGVNINFFSFVYIRHSHTKQLIYECWKL